MVRPTMYNQNVRLAKQRWTGMPKIALIALRELTRQYRLSIALGDLLYIHEHWYVSHTGLLRLLKGGSVPG